MSHGGEISQLLDLGVLIGRTSDFVLLSRLYFVVPASLRFSVDIPVRKRGQLPEFALSAPASVLAVRLRQQRANKQQGVLE